MDWSIAHWINHAVATRDWLEDPVTRLAQLAVPLFVIVASGCGCSPGRTGGAVEAGLGLGARRRGASRCWSNQVISHTWERARPFTTHPLADHLLAPMTTDPSFPSDHAAAAFAIAVAVLLLAPRVGVPSSSRSRRSSPSPASRSASTTPPTSSPARSSARPAATVVGTAGARWVEAARRASSAGRRIRSTRRSSQPPGPADDRRGQSRRSRAKARNASAARLGAPTRAPGRARSRA